MYTRIAIALDTTLAAERVLRFAAGLIRPGAGHLDLVHIHEPVRPGEELEALPVYGWEQIVEYDDDLDRAALAAEEVDLGTLAARLAEERGITTEVHVLRGRPGETLAWHARQTLPDLVIAPTRAEHDHRRGATGTVVRRSGAPVLLLRPPPPGKSVRIERILVPLDGSAFAATILEPVVELARATLAEVTLLRAPGEPVSSLMHLASGPADPERYLEAVRAGFPPDLRAPEIRLPMHPDPATAILREAQCGFDLVALSTHGWGGPRELMFGSTTARVLDDSNLPVLAFHPTARALQAMQEQVVLAG